MDRADFCAQMSAVAGEPIYGTAVQVDVWICLEYRAPWNAKALKDNVLPAPMKEWLQQATDSLAAVGLKARPQFIKRASRGADAPLHLFIARNDDVGSVVWQFNSLDYDAFLELDILTLLQDEEGYEGHLRLEPLFLVCTNGKRDRCCASLGMPVYKRFVELAPEQTWQTTHLGGHRFAATLQVFPDALCYGRVGVEDVEEIIAAQQAHRMLVERLRGSTAYPAEVQAADYFLRSAEGLTRRTDVQFDGMSHDGETTTVRFLSGPQAVRRSVTVSVDNDLKIPTSCGDEKAKPVQSYRLVSLG